MLVFVCFFRPGPAAVPGAEQRRLRQVQQDRRAHHKAHFQAQGTVRAVCQVTRRIFLSWHTLEKISSTNTYKYDTYCVVVV